jgi:uncharacterized protein YjbI with pentapeptide repeats
LRTADLRGANLRGADLSFAFLSRANLSRANLLRDAKKWTSQQLAEAESLISATLPDGRVMTDEA